MKSYGMTIQIKATKQHFPVVLFIILYKVVLTFESVDEILKCAHSNETELLSSTFLWVLLLNCTNWFQRLSLWANCYRVTIQKSRLKSSLPSRYSVFIIPHKVFIAFEFMDEIQLFVH